MAFSAESAGFSESRAFVSQATGIADPEGRAPDSCRRRRLSRAMVPCGGGTRMALAGACSATRVRQAGYCARPARSMGVDQDLVRPSQAQASSVGCLLDRSQRTLAWVTVPAPQGQEASPSADARRPEGTKQAQPGIGTARAGTMAAGMLTRPAPHGPPGRLPVCPTHEAQGEALRIAPYRSKRKLYSTLRVGWEALARRWIAGTSESWLHQLRQPPDRVLDYMVLEG
jgi:hypothetical protein